MGNKFLERKHKQNIELKLDVVRSRRREGDRGGKTDDRRVMKTQNRLAFYLHVQHQTWHRREKGAQSRQNQRAHQW